MPGHLNVVIGQSPAELTGPQARLDWLARALDRIGAGQADLLILPELFVTGYNIGDRVVDWAEPRDGPSAQRISDLARTHGIAIHYGYAERQGAQVFNAAACYDARGARIGHHRKLLLPPGFEGDHFAQGTGCTLFRIGGFTVATLICYDAEFPETVRHVADRGADLVVVPTALAAQWGVVARTLIPTRAFENGVHLCYANHCGTENGLAFLGDSCIVAPDGTDLARAGAGECLLAARLDRAAVTAAQARLPYLRDRGRLPWDIRA